VNNHGPPLRDTPAAGRALITRLCPLTHRTVGTLRKGGGRGRRGRGLSDAERLQLLGARRDVPSSLGLEQGTPGHRPVGYGLAGIDDA